MTEKTVNTLHTTILTIVCILIIIDCISIRRKVNNIDRDLNENYARVINNLELRMIRAEDNIQTIHKVVNINNVNDKNPWFIQATEDNKDNTYVEKQ